MNTSLVSLVHGKPATTSLLISECFDKAHYNVMRDIQALDYSPEFIALNFEVNEYTDAIGRTLPMYTITEKGFYALAMGFTGEKAARFKEAYINAFDEMRQVIHTQQQQAAALSEDLKDALLSHNPMWQKLLRYKAAGLNNIECGKLLGVSRDTVRAHALKMRALQLFPDQQVVHVQQLAWEM